MAVHYVTVKVVMSLNFFYKGKNHDLNMGKICGDQIF